MRKTDTLRPALAGLAGSLLAAALVLLGGVAVATDEPGAGDPFAGSIKLIDWDGGRGLGTFKGADKKYYVVEMFDETRIRVDRPVPAGKWQALSKEAPEVWCFAEKQTYARAARTVGRLRPRLILAAGFAIAPLPEGERNVEGVIGILGWHHGTDVDWKKSGFATVDGELFDLLLDPKGTVLFGTEGGKSDIKKGLKVHLDGAFADGTFGISKSGKLISEAEAEKSKKQLHEVPVIEAERVVVLHKAFSKVYRYCFSDSFSD